MFLRSLILQHNFAQYEVNSVFNILRFMAQKTIMHPTFPATSCPDLIAYIELDTTFIRKDVNHISTINKTKASSGLLAKRLTIIIAHSCLGLLNLAKINVFSVF